MAGFEARPFWSKAEEAIKTHPSTYWANQSTVRLGSRCPVFAALDDLGQLFEGGRHSILGLDRDLEPISQELPLKCFEFGNAVGHAFLAVTVSPGKPQHKDNQRAEFSQHAYDVERCGTESA